MKGLKKMTGLFEALKTAVSGGLDPTQIGKQLGQTLSQASATIQQLAEQAGEAVVRAEFPLVFDYVPPVELSQAVDNWRDHDTQVQYLAPNVFKVTEGGKSVRLSIVAQGNGCRVTADGDPKLMFAIANLLEGEAYKIKTVNVRTAAYSELERRDAAKQEQDSKICSCCGTARNAGETHCASCGNKFEELKF